jgi:hypothetical protein
MGRRRLARILVVVSRWPRWRVLGLVWLAQLALTYVVSPLWFLQGGTVRGDEGRWLGRFDAGELAQLFASAEFHLVTAVSTLVICALQAVLLWPVRRPGPRAARGWSMKISLGVAGLACAALTVGLVIAVLGTLEEFGGLALEFVGPFGLDPEWMLLLFAVLAWTAWTPLLLAFTRAGSRESALGRVSARILLGTIIEVAAILPLDVMVRRKTDCYCATGTYLALTLAGMVGLFAMGPAVLLPLLARRRKRWYHGRCDACAYDMSATPNAHRCPECGAGWRAPASAVPS